MHEQISSKEQPEYNLNVPKQKRSRSKKAKRCKANRTNLLKQESQVLKPKLCMDAKELSLNKNQIDELNRVISRAVTDWINTNQDFKTDE
jgi:hypothetical protein